MKKLLSFALVLAMILGSVSMVFATSGVAYTDTKGIEEEEAINVLTGLGVVEGYGDGTFKPTKLVKRSEMVRMICAALNLHVVEGNEYPTKFTDVAPTAWYAGYVYYAVNLGIVEGKSDTIFDPDAPVKYDEAITMVMRALGYTEECLNGSYPSCFVSKAVGLGALKGLKAGTEAANRADCAQLIFNVLQANIGKVGADGKWEAYVYTNAGIGGSGDGTDNMLTRLGAHLAVDENGEAKELFVGEETLDADNVLVNLTNYLGHVVTYYENEDGDVVAIAKVLTTELVGKFKDGKLAGKKVVDGLEDEEVEHLFVNGTEDTDVELKPFDGEEHTFIVYMDGAKVDEVVSCLDWVVTHAGVVDKDDLKDMLDEDVYAIFGVDLPTNDDDELEMSKVVLKGVDSLEDIEENNVVYLYEGKDAIARIDVGTEVVEGNAVKVSTSTGKPTVDGKAYALAYTELDEDVTYDDEDDVATKDNMLKWATAGKDGKLYLDFNGKVYSADFEEKTTSNYVVLLKYQEAQDGVKSSIDGSVGKIEVFTADGEDVVYELSDDVDLDVFKNVCDKDGLGNGSIVKIALNSKDQVKSVEETEPESANGIKIDKSGNVGEKTVLKSSTVLFKYDNTKKVYKAAAWSVATTKSLFGTTPEKLAFVNDSKGNAEVAVCEDATKTDEHLVILVGSYEIKDKKFEIDVVEGEDLEASYTATEDVTSGASMGVDAVLYSIQLTSDGKIDGEAEEWVGDETVGTKKQTVEFSTTKATKFENDNVLVTYGTGEKVTFTIDEDIIVYVYDKSDKEWSIGKFSDLSGIKAGKNVLSLDLYDTVENKKNPEFLYNIAIMVVK